MHLRTSDSRFYMRTIPGYFSRAWKHIHSLARDRLHQISTFTLGAVSDEYSLRDGGSHCVQRTRDEIGRVYVKTRVLTAFSAERTTAVGAAADVSSGDVSRAAR